MTDAQTKDDLIGIRGMIDVIEQSDSIKFHSGDREPGSSISPKGRRWLVAGLRLLLEQPIYPDDPDLVARAKLALCAVPQLFLDNPEPHVWNVCRWGDQPAGEPREVVLDRTNSESMAMMKRDRLILDLRARTIIEVIAAITKGAT